MMNANRFFRISLRLVAGLLLLTSTFAAVVPARAYPSAPDRDWQKYERRVLKEIMKRHLYELEIARLCVIQATHPELITLCQALITRLPTEISTLQSWMLAWYGVSYTPRLDVSQKAILKHLSLSRLKGAKFEIQSMKLYRVLFRGGANQEWQCARRALHTELGTYCSQDWAAVTQNFRDVTRWLCNWYERCYGSAVPTTFRLEDW